MEALSPRDANAQRAAAKPDPSLKTAAQLRAVKEKDHPPMPPTEINEPASIDRPDGAVYVVGKMLGKGGFAVCYHGQLQSTRQRFALKIVKSKMPPKMEQKFQTELQIHSKMRHQNIVQFFRAFSFNACTFLVLELCPNGSLMDMVKRRRGLTEAEVRFYTVQIAGAMKYMHSKGIIHRDLKMGNIFLDADMNAKIGDFGLAALMVTGRDMQTIRRTTLCGTPNYIAPEILEKGKKGHDHMVDVWSLGVIVFAMLTSKPPFQSTTTDEIYRKARERDYEWPKVDAIISPEAKDLVALMLQDADERPYPDEIVQHPFFVSGYVPSQADMTTRLRELPPDKAEFYTGRMSSARAARVVESLRSFCRECGVGPWSDRQMVLTHVWKEVAAEEKAGLTPAIPLAENIVYRPFEEWMREQRELVERSGYRSLAQNSMGYNNTYSNTLPRLHPSSAPPADDLFSIAPQRTQPPLGLLRAPPQSFAAQQRALNRPTNLAPAAKRQGPEMAISTGTFTGTPAAIIDATLPSRPKQSETTAGSEATLSLRPKHRDVAPAPTAPAPAPAARAPGPASKPATTMPSPPSSQEPNELNAPKARRPPPPPTMRDAAPNLKPAAAATAATAAAAAVAAGKVDEAAQRPRSKPETVESKSSSGSTDSLGSSSSAEARSAEPPASLIGPHENMQIMAGTSPDTILQRLQRLEIELERALNSRSMAFVSSRTVTPRQPPMVIKWVDYTNKYGLGYMLSNGTVGCLVKALPTPDGDRVGICPATCVLVRGAVDHLQRRKDPSYPDRRQPTPMDRDVGFFEFGSEEGVAAVRVPPQMFQVMVHDDDTVGKMRQGKDVYEHRKRERVIVWKRLGYYMAARGRDESILVDPAGGAGGEDWESQHQHQQPNPELVVLYQGFGDARCWVFADGHLQFNFPDHTKIVIDPTGTWCHFWHLPKEAAARLAESGTLGDTALDKRSALTYPLQTLLNFQAKSTTISASARTTTRRRPEIDPELQGVPAANDFRRKIAFIRDVVSEWVANGGLGNSSMDRARRLRWSGYRELNPPNTYEKHVWVTLGARWGDRRVATHLDPRAPHELGEDLDDGKRKKKA